MNDFIGVRKYCSLCEYSTRKEESIVCTNKSSKLYGLRVNEVLCAPCIKPKELEKETEVEAVSFS